MQLSAKRLGADSGDGALWRFDWVEITTLWLVCVGGHHGDIAEYSPNDLRCDLRCHLKWVVKFG